MSEIVYRDPPPVYPENGVNVPLGDQYMRLIVVCAPTATGTTYRSADYVSKLAMRNGSGILDMFTFRGKSTLVATRYLMVFDSVAEPVAGTRPIVPCWTLAAGQWSTWEPEDGIALVNGLYVANSSSEVDYQPVEAGFAMVGCEVDAGTLTGTRRVVEVDASRDFRMRVGLDSLLFDEEFSGATLNASKWQAPVTTQTVTVGGGVATLNGSNITTINTVSRIVSYKTFPVRTSFPTYVEIRAGVFGGSLGIPNTQLEWGIGNVTGTTVVATDGARFYWDAAGAFLAEVTYNGAPINADITAMVAGAGVTENAFQSYLIVIDVGDVYFYIGNHMAARISTPNGAPFPFSSAALPVYARALNAAVAPATASQVRVATFTVSQGDMNNARPWADVMSLQGDNAIQQPTGTASAQTANYANSAVPATATLSNTAAGYTTLGGQFVFAAPAGAETDYALFGFQVPALAAFGKAPNMVLRGVRISAINVGATVATTATVVQWGVGIGSTAVSLATVDAATTRAPRRLALGYHTFAVGAGIGASGGADLWHQFLAPQSVESGTFIHIICKIPVGTATASQQIRGTVAVDAHWE